MGDTCVTKTSTIALVVQAPASVVPAWSGSHMGTITQLGQSRTVQLVF
jgi:hypothetical protein